jgi:hypothetical protein
MTTATATKKTRTVRLAADGKALVIRQQTGRQAIQTDAYFLARTAEGWTLSKHDGKTRYEVNAAAGTCQCRGHQQHGHKTVCKHVAAIKQLSSLGKLAAA